MGSQKPTKRYLLCGMYLLGAVLMLLGGLLVFLGGGALLFVMIGLAIGAGGLRLIRSAAVRAGAVSSRAKVAVESKLEHRVRFLFYMAAISTLLFWLPFVFGDPHVTRQFGWLVGAFFISLAAWAVTFAILIGARARALFFKDSGETQESVLDVSIPKSNFLHEIKTSKVAKRLRILGYVALALIVVLFVLLFSIPKSSELAIWLLYGIVVAMAAYACSGLSIVCFRFWKAIARTRDERRNARPGSFNK